jgi:hypothetical protein
MLPVSVPTASILWACTGAGLLRLGDGSLRRRLGAPGVPGDIAS